MSSDALNKTLSYITPVSWAIHPAFALGATVAPLLGQPFPMTVAAIGVTSLNLGLGTQTMANAGRIDQEDANMIMQRGYATMFAATMSNYLHDISDPSAQDLTISLLPGIAFIGVQGMFVNEVLSAKPSDQASTPREHDWDSTTFIIGLTTAFFTKFLFNGYSLPVLFMVGGASYILYAGINELCGYVFQDKPPHIMTGALGYAWDNNSIVDYALDKARFALQNQEEYGSKDWDLAMKTFKKAKGELKKHQTTLTLDAAKAEFDKALVKSDEEYTQHPELKHLLGLVNASFDQVLDNFTLETSTTASRAKLFVMFMQGGFNNFFYNIKLTKVPEEYLEKGLKALGYTNLDFAKLALRFNLIEGAEEYLKIYSYPREYIQTRAEEGIDTFTELLHGMFLDHSHTEL